MSVRVEVCAPKRKRAGHTRLLARLLLVRLFHLPLAPGVVLRGLGALLTRTGHASQSPIPGQRTFLRGRAGWLRFPGFMTMIGPASPMLGLGAQAPMDILLG